ncbi:MAG: hypothetical protein SFH39_00310 [Candidatus Magnetobacterium sp. LHC-1]
MDKGGVNMQEEMMLERINKLETRVAVLEAGHEVLERDITDVKNTIKEVHCEMKTGFKDVAIKQDSIADKQDNNKKWIVGTLATTSLSVIAIVVSIIIAVWK